MADATNFLKDELILWITDAQDFEPAPTSLYVALHNGPPGPNAGDNEITFAGYSRYQSSPSEWDQPSTGSFENSVNLEFAEAEEDWGDISHFSIWDGPEATDNPLASDSLFSSVTVNNGDIPVFRAGNLAGTFR